MSECLFVSWLITERCNFRCSYCSIFNPFTTQKRFLRKFKKIASHRKWPSPKYDLHRHLDDVLERFRATGKDVCFGFTGGEPLVYPGFLEILSRIAAHDRFTVALDTNLAIKNIGDLMRAVPPEKVEYIFSSLHAEEREKLYGNYDKFLDDVLTLKANGYNIEVSYPLPPYLLDRFKADYDYCMKRGVELAFRVFTMGKLTPRHTQRKSCGRSSSSIHRSTTGTVSRAVNSTAAGAMPGRISSGSGPMVI